MVRDLRPIAGLDDTALQRPAAARRLSHPQRRHCDLTVIRVQSLTHAVMNYGTLRLHGGWTPSDWKTLFSNFMLPIGANRSPGDSHAGSHVNITFEHCPV